MFANVLAYALRTTEQSWGVALLSSLPFIAKYDDNNLSRKRKLLPTASVQCCTRGSNVAPCFRYASLAHDNLFSRLPLDLNGSEMSTVAIEELRAHQILSAAFLRAVVDLPTIHT